MPKHLVIIGFSHAAHGLLTGLKKGGVLPDTKVTVIEPSTHFVWHIAGVRAIHDKTTEDRMFLPIEKVFSRFSSFASLVQDRVSSVDPASKVVTTDLGQTVPYDVLVVASGSSTASPDWKADLSSPFSQAHSPTQKMRDFVTSIRDVLATDACQTIVIGGGGLIGIETAGELAVKYPHKKIHIISSTSTFMDPQTSELPASFGSKVQDQLTKLGVDIKFSTRVESPTATSISPVDVKLSNGEVIKADFYISCIGVTPNSSFLPANFLDSRGWIKTLPTLQTDADTNIFAIGDVASFNRKLAYKGGEMGGFAAQNIRAVLLSDGTDKAPQLKPYTGDTGMVMCFASIGPNQGVGQLGFVPMPSFIVKTMKSKDLLISMQAEKLVK